jgi:glycerophosphoryl diester phosphodiesterase
MRDLMLEQAQKFCDVLVGMRSYPASSKFPKPKLVAHRGAWDRTANLENTLCAFHRARELGADAIELDVHFTADDVPVVHHDSHLERIFGHQKIIRALTFAELRQLEPAVPLLSEVLEISDVHFFIEIKTPLNRTQLLILEKTLENFSAIQDYHFLVLNPDLVRITPTFKSQAWILVGELHLKYLVEISEAKNLGGVAGHYLGMTDALIRRLHEANQIAGTGFIPNENLFNREWNRSIDFVFTNSVATCTAQLND